MNLRPQSHVICYHCDRIVTYKRLDSHFCFKGVIVSYYFDTDYPHHVMVFNGKIWYRISAGAFLFLSETPKLNRENFNDSNPKDLPVLDMDFC